jgi:hypothetical protein
MKIKTINLIALLVTFSSQLFAQKNVVVYDTLKVNPTISFVYPDTSNNLYLRELRNTYALDTLFIGKKNDIEKVLAVLNWTHNQWNHNGSNEPSKSDALTILKEAKEGKKFRCVEYGIVSSKALLSLNYKARILSLKTKEVETAKRSAGHVLAEVWSPEFNKWILIDGQFNLMPLLNNIPLNAVEFQRAIAQNKDFKLVNIHGEVSKKEKKRYLSFIYEYLYYLDVRFGERGLSKEETAKIDNKMSLFLVPIGAKEPTVFQRKYPINYALYTNSIKDFYKQP